jgi:hypothetical protein
LQAGVDAPKRAAALKHQITGAVGRLDITSLVLPGRRTFVRRDADYSAKKSFT